MSTKKTAGTWGYMLIAPGRPSKEAQKIALDTMGVRGVWADEIERGSTRPRSQLIWREALLKYVKSGDTVIFAAPYCVALSEKDALWFLSELSSRGVTVIVTGDMTKIEPGEDYSDMVRRVASKQRTNHTRQSERRAGWSGNRR